MDDKGLGLFQIVNSVMEKRKQGSVVVTGVEIAILNRVIRESKSLRK